MTPHLPAIGVIVPDTEDCCPAKLFWRDSTTEPLLWLIAAPPTCPINALFEIHATPTVLAVQIPEEACARTDSSRTTSLFPG